LQLTGCTISGNSTTLEGGGLDNDGVVTLSDCTFSNNSAHGYGGGLENEGTAKLTDCTISGNTAGDLGGGLDNTGSGNLTLTDCTIGYNSAFRGGGLANGNIGGGATTLTACTISSNSASNSAGGLYNEAPPAGLVNSSPSTVTLNDTIVAGNKITGGGDSDIHGDGGTVSGSYDLIGDGGAGNLVNGMAGSIVGVADPLLASLGNYGGPTQTFALLPGSPALAEGSAALEPSTDQRGSPLDKAGPDIGAYQSKGFTLTVPSLVQSQSTPINTAFPEWLTVIVKANDGQEPVDGVISFTLHSSTKAGAIFVSTANVENGEAQVMATANGIAGSYTVVASAGSGTTAKFDLKNTAGTSNVVVTPLVNPKGKKGPLRLEAQVDPAVDPILGAAVPTGTVTFEVVRGKKHKVIGKATLSGGQATLTVKNRSSVVHQKIEVIYGGDSDFQESESPLMTIN
jgi:hypothetical protein